MISLSSPSLSCPRPGPPSSSSRNSAHSPWSLTCCWRPRTYSLTFGSGDRTAYGKTYSRGSTSSRQKSSTQSSFFWNSGSVEKSQATAFSSRTPASGRTNRQNAADQRRRSDPVPPQLNELGFYTLAGAPQSPAELLDEVARAEALGLGSAFISERFNIKEAGVLSGAAGAVSHTLGIATAATNHNTRHPMVSASYATTMHRLTGGRFTFGLGRGIAPLFDAYGIPRITTAPVEDFVGLMRRLFCGEVVIGHDGAAGRFPVLHLDSSFDENIPIGGTAFGPNSVALGGHFMDLGVLHTFFPAETPPPCVPAVRAASEAAGRDPASVRIWSCYATVH